MDVTKNWFDHELEPYQRLSGVHENSIETIAFNPANNVELASGSHDKTIRIWDIQKFKTTTKLVGHRQKVLFHESAGVWATTYSQDGKVLLSGSPDKTILVWDTKKAKPVTSLKEHVNKIYWVKASDDGKYFLSGGEDGRVIVWDMRKMALIKKIQASKDIVYNTNFLPGNKFLISSDSLGQLKIFDTLQYELRASTPARKEKAYCVDSLPTMNNGQITVLAGYSNKKCRQWSFNPNSPQLTLTSESIVHMDCVTSLTAAKGMYATGSRDGSSRIWSSDKLNDGRNAPLATLIGHNQKITQIAFQPAGAQNQLQPIVATASWDQSINLYKL